MLMKNETGFVIWLTGLPASGKSTLARALRDALAAEEIPVQVLDSDELRQILTPEPTYTSEERDWFYNVVVYITGLLADNGVNTIVAATASKRRYRQKARSRLDQFAEVYVICPEEVCRQRDPKDLWLQAESGQIGNLPGVNAPYQEPLSPEVEVDTTELTPREAAKKVIKTLSGLSLLPVYPGTPR
jgi:adenylylsulfate kinase